VSSEWKARDMEEHRQDIQEQADRDRRAHEARKRRRRWWPFGRRTDS
jgi:hypothetical protein